MTLSQEFTTFVSLASGVVVLVGFFKLLNTPLKNIETNTKEIDKIKKDIAKKNEIDRAIDRAILNSLTAITNHMIDGTNGVDLLRKSRDELVKTISEIATK